MITIFKNLILRKKFKLSPNVVIYKTARIINNIGVRDAIEIGDFSHIRGELLTFGHGGNIRVGEYCYIGEHTRIWSADRIEIGDRVLISHNVNIYDNLTHPFKAALRHKQFKEIIKTGQPKQIDLHERPVFISNDVLIGSMAIILSGVTIGEGAVIGAGSVVTKDVPPWTIVAGNPAKIIRELSEDER